MLVSSLIEPICRMLQIKGTQLNKQPWGSASSLEVSLTGNNRICFFLSAKFHVTPTQDIQHKHSLIILMLKYWFHINKELQLSKRILNEDNVTVDV